MGGCEGGAGPSRVTPAGSQLRAQCWASFTLRAVFVQNSALGICRPPHFLPVFLSKPSHLGPSKRGLPSLHATGRQGHLPLWLGPGKATACAICSGPIFALVPGVRAEPQSEEPVCVTQPPGPSQPESSLRVCPSGMEMSTRVTGSGTSARATGYCAMRMAPSMRYWTHRPGVLCSRCRPGCSPGAALLTLRCGVGHHSLFADEKMRFRELKGHPLTPFRPVWFLKHPMTQHPLLWEWPGEAFLRGDTRGVPVPSITWGSRRGPLPAPREQGSAPHPPSSWQLLLSS